MKFARFWTREASRACRGWSNVSIEDARRQAAEIAGRMAARIASGNFDRREYLYGDRPLPEPIIEQFNDAGSLRAMITRNAYGALVLNTSEMLFLDIDREDPPPQTPALDMVSSLLSFFGKAPPPAPAKNPPSGVVSQIERIAQGRGLAVRVYRTAAGYRGIVTNQRFAPDAQSSQELLREFGCDPLYIRLCKSQESFRARLTPKPWRCGWSQPPVSFPFEGALQQAQFAEWQRSYDSNAAAYATCEYVQTIGGYPPDSAFADLIRLHDNNTKATSGLPLA